MPWPLRAAHAWLLPPLAIAALLTSGPEAASPAAPTRVLYLGDSLGVGTAPHLRSMLTGVRIDQDTRVGHTSTQALAALRSTRRGSHHVLIFDVGTNDFRATVLARNLRRARRLTRGRQMVVFTLNKPDVGPFNKAIRRFASSARNVTVIDWYAIARRRRLLAADGVHVDVRGYWRRARLLARRVGSPA